MEAESVTFLGGPNNGKRLETDILARYCTCLAYMECGCIRAFTYELARRRDGAHFYILASKSETLWSRVLYGCGCELYDELAGVGPSLGTHGQTTQDEPGDSA